MQLEWLEKWNNSLTIHFKLQKQPARGVLRKRCSENMQQICWRTHMPKCEHLEGCFWSQQISQVILINRFYKNILISQYQHSQPGIFCIDFESFVRILTSCCCGYHYCTTSFKQILNSGSGHDQTGDSRLEDLWQRFRLEIRLNAFRWSTIPQKQFIIIIINLFYFTFT